MDPFPLLRGEGIFFWIFCPAVFGSLGDFLRSCLAVEPCDESEGVLIPQRLARDKSCRDCTMKGPAGKGKMVGTTGFEPATQLCQASDSKYDAKPDKGEAHSPAHFRRENAEHFPVAGDGDRASPHSRSGKGATRRRDVREVGEPPRTDAPDLTPQATFGALLELATMWNALDAGARAEILDLARLLYGRADR